MKEDYTPNADGRLNRYDLRHLTNEEVEEFFISLGYGDYSSAAKRYMFDREAIIASYNVAHEDVYDIYNLDYKAKHGPTGQLYIRFIDEV